MIIGLVQSCQRRQGYRIRICLKIEAKRNTNILYPPQFVNELNPLNSFATLFQIHLSEIKPSTNLLPPST